MYVYNRARHVYMSGPVVSVVSKDEAWPRVLVCAYMADLEARHRDFTRNYLTFHQVAGVPGSSIPQFLTNEENVGAGYGEGSLRTGEFTIARSHSGPLHYGLRGG